MEQVLANEREPMTLNPYFVDTYNKQRLADFRGILKECFAQAPSESILVGSNPSTATLCESLEAAVIERCRGAFMLGGLPNETQEAEQLGSMLAAYWETSSERFIDTAVQNADHGLLLRLEGECAASLARCTEGDGGAEWAVEILEDDPQVREERRRLEARLMRLCSARSHIRLLVERHGPGMQTAALPAV